MSRLKTGRGHLVPIGLGVALALAACGAVSGYPPTTRPFDAAIWKAHADVAERHNPRWGMVSDVRSRLKAGVTTRADVIALLGPAAEEYETALEGARVTVLGWAIGWWGGAEIDANTLDVALDERGVVVRSSVHQH